MSYDFATAVAMHVLLPGPRELHNVLRCEQRPGPASIGCIAVSLLVDILDIELLELESVSQR